MINYYIISIKGKNPRKLLHQILKLNINVLDIKYFKDCITFKTSYIDYIKIKEIKTTYEINILGTSGINKIKSLIEKYYIFLIFFAIGIIFLIFLTNLTLFINIESNNNEITNLIKKELNTNNLTLFSFKKSYSSLEKIKNKIKSDNKDKIEWLSISYDGIILNVFVIERIKNNFNNTSDYTDIVASKNGYIKDIYARSGEIIKIKDDYVNKGDIIISGNIYRNEKIIGKTSAKGSVYAEVWYKIKLNKSLTYQNKIKTNKGYSTLTIKIFNKSFNLFKIKKNIKETKTRKIFNSRNMTISLNNEVIYLVKNEKYNSKYLTKYLEKLATIEMSKTLDDKEYIIMQKTLKNYQENGNIYVEVFFKVYENIAKEVPIAIIDEKEE